MMSSRESYEVLRIEFKKFLLGGEDCVEGDEFLTFFSSNVKGAKDVLNGARRLKEEGNSFFKKGEIDDALEKYSYAGVVLVQYEFVNDEDKLEFHDLAISILLNFTACLSRQKEFMRVGQICSIILDLSPSNVKAMFRRAKAAMELREYDLAYWDLVMALEVEPNNREVNKEFENVIHVLGEVKSKLDGQFETPIGLGMGLPPNKVSTRKMAMVEKIEPNQSNEEESKGVESQPSIHKESKDCLGNKEEGNLFDRKESVKDDTMEDITNVAFIKNSYLTKPKYRFANRRRSGSTMSISKQDYEILMRGKSIQYFNSKFGSPMTIRVVNRSNDDQGKKDTSQGKQTHETTKIDQTTYIEVDKENSKLSTEERSESGVMETTPFEFKKRKAESSRCDSIIHCQDRDAKMEVRRKSSNMNKSSTRRNKLVRRRVKDNTNSSLPHTNHSCGCRFNVARKRKCVDASSINVYHPPRKKIVSYSCNYRHSSFGDLGCASVSYISCGSVSFGMAYGQSNRDK